MQCHDFSIGNQVDKIIYEDWGGQLIWTEVIYGRSNIHTAHFFIYIIWANMQTAFKNLCSWMSFCVTAVHLGLNAIFEHFCTWNGQCIFLTRWFSQSNYVITPVLSTSVGVYLKNNSEENILIRIWLSLNVIYISAGKCLVSTLLCMWRACH